MKDLIKQYLDSGISRRRFLAGLGGAGLSAAAADAMASSLAPFMAQQGGGESPPWLNQMRGPGGALLVAQLKAAGIRHVFVNPHGASGTFFDALVDEPDIHIIKALEEGALGAMADGYAKASGRPAFAMCDAAGVPAFMGMMVISATDQIPVILSTDEDAIPNATNSITKWQWVAEQPGTIPEITRRALKFATTSPCGPVYLVITGAAFRGVAQADIMDQEKFHVSMKLRPESALVDEAAALLVEAQSPALYIGDEVTWCGAEKEALELAELLGMPVFEPGRVFMWSKPFPSRHPLWVGTNFRGLRYPPEPDVILNLGCRIPLRMNARTKIIEARVDPTSLARVTPVEVGIVGDLKLTTADLLAAVKARATATRLQQLSAPRLQKARDNAVQVQQVRDDLAKRKYDRNPLSNERVAIELENVLERDTCVVQNVDSGHEALWAFLNIGGGNKRWFSESAIVLGWGVGAAFGVQLAMPDTPVVAIVGDGEFMFRGPQPLWSYARYRAPITVLVLNNRSYNNERVRITQQGGRQFQTGRDMVCYMGDPDIDFTKLAAGLGVDGEVVSDPASMRPALERGKRANMDGRPYLLDVRVGREGIGAQSTWHPGYSISAQRRRRV
jgi:benzoylformate decarboxylase